MLRTSIMLRTLTTISTFFLTFAHMPTIAEAAGVEKAWQSDVLREFEELYRPVARADGKNLKLQVVSNESSSGEAKIEGQNIEVILNTGLLKNPNLTPDGLRMLICHELGHIFGGAPRKSIPPEWEGPVASDGRSFATSEGQADYYASASCFHRVIRGNDHQKALADAKSTARAQRQCDGRLGAGSEESLICQRAAAGGENMLQLNRTFPISYDTPDRSVADKVMADAYPDRQCRLDTFLMGAVCRNDMPLVMDFDDAAANDCEGAVRPLCWYPVPVANRGGSSSSTTVGASSSRGGATQR